MENVPEMVFVKEEAVDGTDPIDEYESKLKVKCGEVFAIFGGHLILVCTFCNAHHEDMLLLGEHLRQNHAEEFIKKDDDEYESGTDPVDAADRGNSSVEDNHTSKIVVKSNDRGPYSCEKCDVQYKNRRNLVRHWRKVGCKPASSESEDEITDLEKFIGLRPELLARRSSGRRYCDMCNVSYKNQRNLKRHQTKTGCRQRRKVKVKSVKRTGDYDSRVEAGAKIHIEIVPTGEQMDISLGGELNSSVDYKSPEKVEGMETNSGYEDNQSDCDRHGDEADIGDKLEFKQETSQLIKSELNLDFRCTTCGIQFTSKLALSNHKRLHKLPKKDKSSGTTKTTENASSIAKNPELFCDLCNTYFKNRQSLYVHTDQHDSATLPKVLQSNADYLKCKYCSIKFNKYADRLAHEQGHAGIRPYECPYCRKGFASNMSRNAHLRLHTGESPFQCDQCSRVFRDRFDLRRHVDRHMNIRNETCELCDKKFYNKHQLTLHMRTHTKERPYVCEDCGKTFVVLPQLKDHQLRHTGVKNVICEVCDRRFYSKSVLKVHMASHSDEQPFECNVCGRKFSRAKAMQKHMKLHSGVKNYVCNICGKAYAQDSGLYAHKKTHAKHM